MDHNEDILTEILVRLPVRSLLKFRSVCKVWCSIIDSFAFRKSHQLRNTDKYNEDVAILQVTKTDWRHYEFLMWAGNGKSYKLDIPAFHEFIRDRMGQLAVFGPVNGLICIHNWCPNPYIAICNPCLGKIKILPVSPIICSTICSAWPKYCKIGFGFDYVKGEYKVVQLTLSTEGVIYVEVYSPTTNTWRKLDTDIFDKPFCFLMTMNNSAYKVVSGKWAHWWTQTRFSGGGPEDMLVISSFDMQNEVFKTRVLDISSQGWSRNVVGVYAKGDDSFVIFVRERFRDSFVLFDDKVRILEGNERSLAHARDVRDLRSFGIMSGYFVLDREVGAVLTDFDPERVKLFIHFYNKTEGEPLATDMFGNTVMLEYSCSLISP